MLRVSSSSRSCTHSGDPAQSPGMTLEQLITPQMAAALDAARESGPTVAVPCPGADASGPHVFGELATSSADGFLPTPA